MLEGFSVFVLVLLALAVITLFKSITTVPQGFEYTVEMFVPAAKRIWGYYVFPILEGERFVGRIEVKADRKAHKSQVVENVRALTDMYKAIFVLSFENMRTNKLQDLRRTWGSSRCALRRLRCAPPPASPRHPAPSHCAPPPQLPHGQAVAAGRGPRAV